MPRPHYECRAVAPLRQAIVRPAAGVGLFEAALALELVQEIPGTMHPDLEKLTAEAVEISGQFLEWNTL